MQSTGNHIYIYVSVYLYVSRNSAQHNISLRTTSHFFFTSTIDWHNIHGALHRHTCVNGDDVGSSMCVIYPPRRDSTTIWQWAFYECTLVAAGPIDNNQYIYI